MAANSAHYDFVVVGVGTAGRVMAARLSADSAVRALLLEAGSGQPLDFMAVPPAWPALMGSSADWADRTVLQEATGSTISWPRGRVSGGSSAINANFVRAHRLRVADACPHPCPPTPTPPSTPSPNEPRTWSGVTTARNPALP